MFKISRADKGHTDYVTPPKRKKLGERWDRTSPVTSISGYLAVLKIENHPLIFLLTTQNYYSVLPDHICKVRETKEKSSSTGKWGMEKLKSMDEYKDIWRKYFPYRVDLEKSYANKKAKKKAD